jgi:hypothetical protein
MSDFFATRSTPPPPGNWVPPSGEPLDPWAIYFNEPVAVG